MRGIWAAALIAAVGAWLPAPALASFRLMQMELVAGGVDGDETRQFIQLRMRGGGQNLVSGSLLVAYDAAGANPVVLLTFPSNVPNAAAGARILVCSVGAASDPSIASDFTLSQLIPASYLPACRPSGVREVRNDLLVALLGRCRLYGKYHRGEYQRC